MGKPCFAVSCEGEVMMLRFSSRASMSRYLERVSNCIDCEKAMVGMRAGHNMPVAEALRALAGPMGQHRGAASRSSARGGKQRAAVSAKQQTAPCVPHPLTEEERTIERLLLQTRCRYVVAFQAHDWHTRQHEMLHAKYFLDAGYRQQVEQEWAVLHEGTRQAIQAFLRRLGYREAVFLDEWQAYRGTESPGFFGVRC